MEDRASSHSSYYLGTNPRGWLADSGKWKGQGWSDRDGYIWVSAGSHAGRTASGGYVRWTPADALALIPMETAIYGLDRHGFAVSPGWRKDVYYDPEENGTAGDRDPLPNFER